MLSVRPGVAYTFPVATPSSTTDPIPAPLRKPPLAQRLKTLFVEYGQLALVTYLVIFALVLVGFGVAIKMGAGVESAAGWAGTMGGAYAATKLTQPLRILATLVLTPVVARVVRRVPPAV